MNAYAVYSPTLREDIKFHLYLPPCYSADTVNGYPLLLLLHGQNGNDSQWVDFGVPQAVDEMILKGEILPLVIAFPHERRYLDDPRESVFDVAIVQDFLPYLMENYALSNQREDHAIGGLSRGANWAFQIGMTNPSLFASIGAHSFASFGYEVWRLKYWVAEIEPLGTMRLYFDTGDRDPYKYYWDRVTEALPQYNLAFEQHVFPGSHDAEYWQSHMRDYIRWYSAAWEDTLISGEEER